jgi:hypothetical protein
MKPQLDQMRHNGKSQPQPQPAPTLLKNAGLAPIVYFDGAPVFGTLGGVIEIELAVRMLMPRADNTVLNEFICAAHLRSSVQAAMQLRDALDKAIAMATKPSPNETN